MRKLSSIIAGVLAAMPACAQSQTYSAVAYSNQGGTFELVIHRDGKRLRFDLKATAGATSLSGTPVCDRVELDGTGYFRTHCSKFQAQDGGRYILDGNLNQLSARIDTVYRFGSAEFKLVQGSPPK
jgi:hypothetical protein